MWFFDYLQKQRATVTMVIGALLYIASIAVTVLRDPLWTWGSFWLGTIVLLLGLVIRPILKQDVRSAVLNEYGNQIVQRIPIAPPWVSTALIILLLMSIPLGAYLYRQPHNTFRAVFVDRQEVLYPKGATVDGTTYFSGDTAFNYADSVSEQQDRFFLSDGFYLRFVIQKAHRYKSVDIDKLYVEVTKFDFVPANSPRLTTAYTPPQVMPFREHNLFLVTIDDPKKKGKTIFDCDHYFEWKKAGDIEHHDKQRFAAKILGDDDPESIVVRIEAKTSGLYSIEVKMIAAVETTRETIPVFAKTVFFPSNPLDAMSKPY